MPTHHYMTFAEDGDAFVTWFSLSVGRPLTASTSSHPNFSDIVNSLKAGVDDDELVDLFDVEQAVTKRFDALSERVSVSNGCVYFDGDEIDDALSRQILRFIDGGHEDWLPLVSFMENVASNPEPHSRDQLFAWLRPRDFTITDDGCFIGYKGVRSDLTSVNSGPGIVNGESVKGHLDNSPGNLVEIARSAVQHNPALGCASGLHVGTFDYAKNWGQKVLTVKVNPRDVVSVPTDCSAAKVRVCRYEVLNVTDSPVPDALLQGCDEDEW